MSAEFSQARSLADQLADEVGRIILGKDEEIRLCLACLLAVAAAASGLRLITMSSDYRMFFSEDNPQLQAFEQLQNTYTKTDNILFVLAPKDGRVFSNATLASTITLTEAGGGTLSLVLRPRGTSGEYDGQLSVENVRVRSSSGIAALANAI